ncbi:MAG: GIY-YIG nuclease family protein [Candidatus Omnitrophica bacterium]|nr:GIY-YIG nuclease family protein [Candidatus Omnitrophota bacterium]
MTHVYVIGSQSRNYLYVGLTNDLTRRLYQHQEGKSRTTRAYRPFRLIHSESFGSREEARSREKFLKSGSGKEWIKTIID